MKAEEYAKFDGVALARLVSRGEVHPKELLAAAIEQHERQNPALNAVIELMAIEAGRAIDAGLPDGPLRGVPFLLKDLAISLAGHVTAGGSKLFAAGKPALEDSALVAAYKRAGLVIIGTTNTPEFGITPVTEPLLTGITLNPWDHARTCGGSSGGSAAAVAARIVPAAHASDGGGSIRIPASCCGVFGLKPSRGRVSVAPFSEGVGTAVQHAITRTVRDSALLLDIASKPAPGDTFVAAPTSMPFLQSLQVEPRPLRIAFTFASLYHGDGIEVDADCRAAVAAAASLCETLGHHVEEAQPTYDATAVHSAFWHIFCANIAWALEASSIELGRHVIADDVEMMTWRSAEVGSKLTAVQFADAIGTLQLASRSVAAFFDRYDLLLTSTLGQPPIPVGHLDPSRTDIGAYREDLFRFMPNTQLFNITGQPAMSLPMGFNAEGLPIGVQFVGQRDGEAMLLGLAARIEEASPWIGVSPPNL